MLKKLGPKGLNQLALTNRHYYEMVRAFQKRNGDDRRKYVADIQTFVNVIDDKEKSFKEKFDAICKRIVESKPFYAGKPHVKVRGIVATYLSTLDDAARRDEIYKLLIALASKEELLRTDIARAGQIGSRCVPANKLVNKNPQYLPNAEFFQRAKKRLENRHVKLEHMEERCVTVRVQMPRSL